jgi:hypothetical protein
LFTLVVTAAILFSSIGVPYRSCYLLRCAPRMAIDVTYEMERRQKAVLRCLRKLALRIWKRRRKPARIRGGSITASNRSREPRHPLRARDNAIGRPFAPHRGFPN